jgi:uncharacterized protein (DUF1697 family)
MNPPGCGAREESRRSQSLAVVCISRSTKTQRIRIVGCAYIVYPDGIGRSRLTNQLIEKMLGTRGTGRNWNTVLKLDALADSML